MFITQWVMLNNGQSLSRPAVNCIYFPLILHPSSPFIFCWFFQPGSRFINNIIVFCHKSAAAILTTWKLWVIIIKYNTYINFYFHQTHMCTVYLPTAPSDHEATIDMVYCNTNGKLHALLLRHNLSLNQVVSYNVATITSSKFKAAYIQCHNLFS